MLQNGEQEVRTLQAERDHLRGEVTRLQQTQVPQGEIMVAPFGVAGMHQRNAVT